MTFYLWLVKLRNLNFPSHDKATVDVHGYVIDTSLGVCRHPQAYMLGVLYTYQRGPLRCLSLTERQCEGLTSGMSDTYRSRAFLYMAGWEHKRLAVCISQSTINGNRPVRELRTYHKIYNMRTAKCLLALMLVGTFTVASAQITKEQKKERQEFYKYSKSQLNEKATKAARKEAKRLAKEGWQAAPGALPLERQLDKSYLMQMEYDQDMYPKYLIGEAMSIGGNYDAAKMQALELAKQNLAGQIQTEVTALIENTVANKQLQPEEAASVVQSVSVAKNLISQSIGRTITVIELYRTKQNKNKEVLVRIAYNGDMAKAAAKKAVREQLEDKGEELHKKLDNLLGW